MTPGLPLGSQPCKPLLPSSRAQGWGCNKWGNSSSFQRNFFYEIGISEFFFEWGLTQGVCFWVAWESMVYFPRFYFFCGVGWGGWRKKVSISFSFLFFFVIW